MKIEKKISAGLEEVSKLFIDAGLIVLTPFISPYTDDREQVRSLMKEGQFLEVYVKCSVEECEHRDPKGIYKKVRAGQIKEFTGISSPYEEPEHLEIVLETDKMGIEDCVNVVLDYLIENNTTVPTLK